MTKLYDKRLTDTIEFIETRAKPPRNAAYREDAADVSREWMRAAPRALQQVGELISQGWTAQTVARSAKAVRGAGFPDRLDSAVERFPGAIGSRSLVDTRFHELKSTTGAW